MKMHLLNEMKVAGEMYCQRSQGHNNSNTGGDKMNTKKLRLVAFTVAALTLLVLAGTFGLVVGRAQTPQAKPTPAPIAPIVTVPPPTQEPVDELIPESASISGRVWHDLCAVAGGEGGIPIAPSVGCVQTGDDGYRANGLPEAGEPGIGGVLVQLGAGACPASGLATATTDTSGAYGFAGLNAGTYCVSVDVLSPQNSSLLPGSWTSPFLGADGNVTGHTVILSEDEHRIYVNFGWDHQFLPLPEPPAPEPSPEPEPAPACTDKAAFVNDVTVPDNIYVLTGQPFVKTWRLRNVGTCTWTADYALVFANGHRMGGPSSVPLSGPVAPGDGLLRRLLFSGLSATSSKVLLSSRTTTEPFFTCLMIKWPTSLDCLTQRKPLPGSSINARDKSGCNA